MNFITKNDYAYQRLREEILNVTLKPGERLVISDIAKRYGISAMPIREAITRLSQEGLVEHIQHVGARVYQIHYNEIFDSLQIAAYLEILASRLAARFITEEQIDEMGRLEDEMDTCVQGGNIERYTQLNRRFHQVICNAHPNRALSETIELLNQKTQATSIVSFRSQERMHKAGEEHRLLIAAMRGRNSDVAAQVFFRHRISAAHKFVDFLEECVDNPAHKDASYYLHSIAQELDGESPEEVRRQISQYRMMLHALENGQPVDGPMAEEI